MIRIIKLKHKLVIPIHKTNLMDRGVSLEIVDKD